MQCIRCGLGFGGGPEARIILRGHGLPELDFFFIHRWPLQDRLERGALKHSLIGLHYNPPLQVYDQHTPIMNVNASALHRTLYGIYFLYFPRNKVCSVDEHQIACDTTIHTLCTFQAKQNCPSNASGNYRKEYITYTYTVPYSSTMGLDESRISHGQQ